MLSFNESRVLNYLIENNITYTDSNEINKALNIQNAKDIMIKLARSKDISIGKGNTAYDTGIAYYEYIEIFTKSSKLQFL